MQEWLKIILPILVALIGAYLAYRQWYKQPQRAINTEYLKNRQKAYKELWERLEDTHISLRSNTFEKSEFDKSLKDVNSFILKNQIFLEDVDQQETNQYLKSIYDFAETLRRLNQKEKEETEKNANDFLQIEKEWIQTGKSLPMELQGDAREFIQLNKEMEDRRTKLIERFKRNIGS